MRSTRVQPWRAVRGVEPRWHATKRIASQLGITVVNWFEGTFTLSHVQAQKLLQSDDDEVLRYLNWVLDEVQKELHDARRERSLASMIGAIRKTDSDNKAEIRYRINGCPTPSIVYASRGLCVVTMGVRLDYSDEGHVGVLHVAPRYCIGWRKGDRVHPLRTLRDNLDIIQERAFIMTPGTGPQFRDPGPGPHHLHVDGNDPGRLIDRPPVDLVMKHDKDHCGVFMTRQILRVLMDMCVGPTQGSFHVTRVGDQVVCRACDDYLVKDTVGRAFERLCTAGGDDATYRVVSTVVVGGHRLCVTSEVDSFSDNLPIEIKTMNGRDVGSNKGKRYWNQCFSTGSSLLYLAVANGSVVSDGTMITTESFVDREYKQRVANWLNLCISWLRASVMSSEIHQVNVDGTVLRLSKIEGASDVWSIVTPGFEAAHF